MYKVKSVPTKRAADERESARKIVLVKQSGLASGVSSPLTAISDIRGGWAKGGNGLNPNHSWNTPSAHAEPIDRPQVGDYVNFAFSSRFTRQELNKLGLGLDDNNIVIQAAGS